MRGPEAEFRGKQDANRRTSSFVEPAQPSDIGALIIRRVLGPFYYNYNKEPPPK